jgi:histidinol-phosphate aminotransferase
MPKDDILDIVRYCKKSIVVVDEAYADFCDTTVIPYVKEYENLLVLKTFSKAFGLAGIRCGYSISCAKLANAVNLARPPYNIGSLSQFIAKLILSEKEQVYKNIELLVEQREWMAGELAKLQGIKVYNSSANFLLVKVDNCNEVNKKLCEKGIFVRAFGSSPLLEGCLRITIGTQEQNTILLDELSTICYNN